MRVRQVELPGRRAALAPRLHPVAVLIVLGDARVDVAVADVEVAVRVPRDVGRLAEQAVHVRQRRIGMLPRPRVLVGGFLPPAVHLRHAPGAVELDDHVRALVDGPDVVVLVDAHRVRERPRVEVLADFADELALGAELEQLRRRRRIGRSVRALRAGEHEDVPLRIDRDAGDLAEVHAGRQLEEIWHRNKRQRRNRRLLGADWPGGAGSNDQKQNKDEQPRFHARLRRAS